MAEPDATVGQAEAAPEAPKGTTEGTTQSAPEGTQGQSAAPDQTTASGPGAGNVESFFDPDSIKGKPELEAAYKQMQSAFTKRMQEASKHKDKVRQYDEFVQNPVENMRQLAQQYGYQLVQGPKDQNEAQKEFNSWDDVMAEAEQRVMSKLEPMFGELRDLKKQNVEQWLDGNYSDWRQYEDQMMETLQAHPTLVKDPDKLYRLSVPSEVLESRAFKKAQQKLQGTTEGSQIQGQSSTTKQTSETPKGPLSFNQAVEVAKQRLAKQGITAPRGE